MSSRIAAALATALVLGQTSFALADGEARKTPHHRHAKIAPKAGQPISPAPNYGGRLVMHPAWNIACMTRDRATRALPCDQPVWVYGSPCEIDLGLGRYRPCD